MKKLKHFYELMLGCPFDRDVNKCVIETYREMSLVELIDRMNRQNMSILFNKYTLCDKCRTEQKVAV
jgi:hypothetical protein